jgi:N-acetyl-anhydromuramyl-L-alanine amidase AmpD
VKQTQRKFVVFSSLVAVLTLTSALLLALAPAPLTPDATSSLFAIDAPDSMDVIFRTAAPTKADRWNYIYVHQSRTTGGNALTLSQRPGGLGDHFVIGNGDGAIDGEIQVAARWDAQLAAAPPPGAASINADCISICVIGDFGRSRPTPTQLRRLSQLVTTLQARYRIPADRVMLVPSDSPAGLGPHFPLPELRQQLLP